MNAEPLAPPQVFDKRDDSQTHFPYTCFNTPTAFSKIKNGSIVTTLLDEGVMSKCTASRRLKHFFSGRRLSNISSLDCLDARPVFSEFEYTTIVPLEKEVTNGHTASCGLEEIRRQLCL